MILTRQEREEARARLRAAEGRKAALEKDLAELKAQIEPVERSAEEQLSQLSHQAIAARRKADLALRVVQVYESEGECLAYLTGPSRPPRRTPLVLPFI